MLFATALDVEIGDTVARECGNPLELDHAMAQHIGPVRRQQRILGERHARHRAATEPFLGDKAHTVAASPIRHITTRGMAADDDCISIIDRDFTR